MRKEALEQVEIEAENDYSKGICICSKATRFFLLKCGVQFQVAAPETCPLHIRPCVSRFRPRIDPPVYLY